MDHLGCDWDVCVLTLYSFLSSLLPDYHEVIIFPPLHPSTIKFLPLVQQAMDWTHWNRELKYTTPLLNCGFQEFWFSDRKANTPSLAKMKEKGYGRQVPEKWPRKTMQIKIMFLMQTYFLLEWAHPVTLRSYLWGHTPAFRRLSRAASSDSHSHKGVIYSCLS